MDTDTESIARASSRATRRRARPTRTPAGSMVWAARPGRICLRSEEHTSELQSPCKLVCRLLLEKKHAASVTANRTKRALKLEINKRIDFSGRHPDQARRQQGGRRGDHGHARRRT